VEQVDAGADARERDDPQGFSSETPDRLRGPQHHYVWGEEVSSWSDASKGAGRVDENTTWSNMKLGLRLGEHPRAC
jgi:phage terminase large subunit-like protein